MLDTGAMRSKIAAFAAAELPSLAIGRTLLAVSGGADSVATAALLCEAGVIDARRSTVAHFDHRLRSREAAAADRSAVIAVCGRYDFDLIEGSWDAPRPGEAAARDARYAFLRYAAARVGHRAIVTGHTVDDQAETVLMHAMRGAGLHGLSGMAPEAVVTGVTIARPALCLTRSETRSYCGVLGLAFVDDETNEDRAFTRNRVRLEMLPRDPGARALARASLVRIGEDARRTAELLDAEALAAVVEAGSSMVRLSRAMLRQLGTAVAAHAFRAAIVQLLGDARDIERRHYDMLVGALDGRTGATYELPREIVVTVDARELVFTIGAPIAPGIDPMFVAPLPFTGTVGAWHIEVAPAHLGATKLCLPGTAVIRGRRPGDRMRLRAGTKKLQDVLVDLKVPRRDRDGVPVIASGSDVLWTPFRTADLSTGSGDPWVVTVVPVG